MNRDRTNLKYLHHKSDFIHISRLAVSASILMVLLFGCRRKRQTAQPSTVSELEQPQVRVLLADNVTRCLFSCDGRVSVTASEPVLPRAHFETMEKAVNVELSEGRVSFDGWACQGAEIQIKPDSNEIFILNGRRYRGELEIITARDSNSFDVVNVVGIEEYLAGVIGAEMPSYWEPQALEAQSIAARTYCFYIKQRFGTGRHWDVHRTAAHQMYRGVSEETPAVWKAIENTTGEVLVCKQTDGKEDIFPAYYSSTCAGHTENSKNVFGDTYEPLKGVPCKYCLEITKKDFLNWPGVEMTREQVDKKLFERYPQLRKLGSIEKISAISPSRYDGLTRLTWIKLEGADGSSDTLRAEDFRLALDHTGLKIKSAAFEIQKTATGWAFTSGKGYGHGVGMCQCGAEGMARKGRSMKEILYYYYPDSRIKKLY
jgi:stage II sporulation protein D